tara:strand:- start:14 stop:526 length:513 start_codon:yes stop_codon:yes gene_type:complete
MAITSGSLKVTIQESITLPNKNEEICTNTVTISGVNQTVRRTDTIATSFSGSGIEILKFVDSESEQTAGSFVRDSIKYMRFTNLDNENFLSLYLIQNTATSDDNAIFKINPGKSIVLSNGQFDGIGSGDGNYVDSKYVDSQYFSDLTSLSSIKAKADTSAIQIEYFIASS